MNSANRERNLKEKLKTKWKLQWKLFKLGISSASHGYVGAPEELINEVKMLQ